MWPSHFYGDPSKSGASQRERSMKSQPDRENPEDKSGIVPPPFVLMKDEHEQEQPPDEDLPGRGFRGTHGYFPMA